MTDHVPVEYWPPREQHQRALVTEICAACSQNGVAVPAADCELAAAVLQRTAYGQCPMGCGATGGDVDQSGDLAGFVRLWSHLWHGHDKPAGTHHGVVTPVRPMLPCIGSNSWTVPLPLAAPPEGERGRLLAEIHAAEPPDDAVDEDGYPLTLF